MKRVLVQCDGAVAPPSVQSQAWDARPVLSHRGAGANVNLRIQSPSDALLASFDARATDLVRIASYVYAADQSVSRGGEADIYGKAWHRDMHLFIPVADTSFWARPEVVAALSEVLGFLSGETWSFSFSPAGSEDTQLTLDIDPSVPLGKPDSVFLFSGGMDSLCAVVEAFSEGARPLLIAHSPAFNVRSRQHDLVQTMRHQFSQTWHFPLIGVAIHRTGSDPKEYTQRTRSFLYATMGSVFAQRLGLTSVALADNGIVSLNLPINDQLLGTTASRTTHPRFIWLFNSFIQMALPNAPCVHNPLWGRTRAEVVGSLVRSSLGFLVDQTHSCSRVRGRTRAYRHCGACLQCIDRRFAVLAAGLEDTDPTEAYEIDVFRQHIPEGDARTMALSYVRFAAELSELSPEGMFTRFPQLYDCLVLDEPNQVQKAQGITAMLGRHATTVVQVMANQIAAAKEELVLQKLPPNCLIRLVAAPGSLPSTAAPPTGFQASEDYTSVMWRGQHFTFTEVQATAVEFLHNAWKRNLPDVRHSQIVAHLQSRGFYTKRLRDAFAGSEAWGTLIVSKRKGIYRLDL